jgi:hypothetical protein
MIRIDGHLVTVITGGAPVPKEPVPHEPILVPPALPQQVLDGLPLDALVELRQQYRYQLADLEASITRRLAQPRAEQDVHENGEYLTIDELAGRIGYEEQTIRNLMGKGVFRLGVHYLKPRGRVLFQWPAVEAWLVQGR